MKNDSIPSPDTGSSRRDHVFALLEQAQDWCSGEVISEQLGISRAAVAKHVTALRNAGHAIESAPRRGYRLIVKNDCLSLESMKGLLTTQVLGQKEWRYLEETTSTNKVASLWGLEGAEEGCLVVAEHQNMGRGKKGSTWYSPPRTLQFSVVLHPRFQKNITETLTMTGVVAMAEAILQTSSLQPIIKVPNDILINDRKVCGVLVEVGLSAGDAVWAVLGIGCNVNARFTDFPEEMKPYASSLLVEGNTPLSRRSLLAIVLERLEFWYQRVQRGETSSLESRCRQSMKH